MRHYLTLEGLSLEDTWLTVGTFDGVHRGHQEIVHQLAAGAHHLGYPAVVLTFYLTRRWSWENVPTRST